MEMMSKQDIVNLVWPVEPVQEYNCYSLIGEIAERVARFDDRNAPGFAGLQRYGMTFGYCGGSVTMMCLDFAEQNPDSCVMVYRMAKDDSPTELNELLNLIIYLAKELTV